MSSPSNGDACAHTSNHEEYAQAYYCAQCEEMSSTLIPASASSSVTASLLATVILYAIVNTYPERQHSVAHQSCVDKLTKIRLREETLTVDDREYGPHER
jgi:hypothetical protein